MDELIKKHLQDILTAIEEILIDLTMDSLDLDRKFYFNIK